MNAGLKRFSSSAAVLAMALLVSACASESPDELIASAQSYLQRKDAPAAIIQLKNALQARPQSAQARLLLGEALETIGDIKGAATEYQKAQDYGASADDVAPRLARMLLLQSQYSKVTSDFSSTTLSSAQSQASLQTTLALAWQLQEQPEKFQTHIDAALGVQPDYAPALIASAQARAAKGDAPAALALLDKVVKDAPEAAEAAKLRGDIELYLRNDMERAFALYQEAVQLNPLYLAGQAAIFELQLAQTKLDEASETMQKLVKIAPGQPQTLYLQAKLAYAKQDFKQAQDHTQKLLRLAPDSARALELAGLTEFRLNSYVQAEASLLRALQLSPNLPMAQRGLVMTYSRTGQLDKAVAALPPEIDTQSTDSAMLAVAGQVYLLRGEVDHAQRLFAKATSLDPQNPVKRTSLAVSQLMSGKSEAALGELQNIAASDEGAIADTALVNALLQRKEIDRALEAIAAWEKKLPNDVTAPFLRGRVLLLKQDTAGARKAMDRVLAINSDYFPAIELLALLDNADKRPDVARERIDATLKKNPGNVQAHLALLQLRIANGADKKEQVSLLQTAMAAAPQSSQLRLLMVEYHLRNKEPKEALTAAQQAVSAIPNDFRLMDALGQAQVANGEHLLAQATFNRMAALQPQSPLPFLRLASDHLSQGDRAMAGQNLRKALELQPGLLQAQQGLVALAMADKKPEEALVQTRSMQKQQPKAVAGYLLEGDVHAAAKAWDKSVQAYRAGLKQVPDSVELAVRLHSALMSSGAKADATRWSAEWLRAHPKDPVFPMYLGDKALASNDLQEAKQQFERATELQAGNAAAFNNLAWVKARLKQPGALADAEKANALAPKQPAFMDTWAMLLSEAGQHEKAIDLQKQALALQPQAVLLKLNMAKIYIQAGQKDAARSLLDEIQALGDKFPGKEEAASLRSTL